MSRSLRLLGAALLAALPAAAQSSQFGVRGLGIPLRPISVRATGTAGAFALFDAESALNPASFGTVSFLGASFQTVQSWRHSISPAGSASGKDNHFPGVFVSGPAGRSRFALAVSVMGYTDRNFQLGSTDSVTLRGVKVGTMDTLTSHGGVSDLRVAVAWRQSRAVQWGIGLHLLTGSNRITSHRVFSDSTYAGASENFTFSYLGYGISAGVVARATRAVTLAASIRSDHHLAVERDTSHFGTTTLPVTLAAGVRYQVSDRFMVAASALHRNWSVANADLVAQGGTGSVNTSEVNGGFEFLTDTRRSSRFPLRFGLSHGTLPFPLQAGLNASETTASFGTSRRFVGDRAGVDVALSRTWRSAGTAFTERTTLFTLGVSIRP
jgi:hypothetical protein